MQKLVVQYKSVVLALVSKMKKGAKVKFDFDVIWTEFNMNEGNFSLTIFKS